ncbi:hypothetical protein [Cupriavidus basilensis]|uniref:hypothetical protein n=1 Tax=Cupriavidus basilensis TaxID=68895 RepID=UPI00157A8C3C|nr:hypothetical protein [Cupriavidus basilensis]NUA26934.1 hypothetical protein [Cupriavidus basilensis]
MKNDAPYALAAAVSLVTVAAFLAAPAFAKAGKFEINNDGARVGNYDPYTDGGKIGKFDPYTDDAAL